MTRGVSFLRMRDEALEPVVAERVLSEQISAVFRNTPSMMFANFGNALIFVVDVWNTPHRFSALIWMGAIYLVSGYIALRRRAPFRSRIGVRRFTVAGRAYLNALALGLCWAALPLVFFQEATPGARLLIACLSSGMLCGGAFALASLPRAAASFALPVACACAFTLLRGGDIDNALIAGLLLIYTAVLLKGVSAYADQLRARVLSQIEGEERARSKMQTFQATGLSAVGEMAAGIAHDVNQPLSACGAYIATARRLLGRETRPSNIEDILAQAAAQNLRAGEIVNHLREFIMRGEPDKKLIGLHELIDNALTIALDSHAALGLDARLELGAENDGVYADRVQILQVLLNLIRNAIDAMDQSASRILTIATANVAGGFIQVDIADTGCGVPDVDVFEPFASTKAGGMGIGLALSRSIIEAHFGKIWAESVEGVGAVFRFVLPLDDAESSDE